MSYTWADFIGTFMSFFYQMVSTGADAFGQALLKIAVSIFDFFNADVGIGILFVFVLIFYFVARSASRRY